MSTADADFNPIGFLWEVHSQTSFDQLQEGLKRLQQRTSGHNDLIKELVKVGGRLLCCIPPHCSTARDPSPGRHSLVALRNCGNLARSPAALRTTLTSSCSASKLLTGSPNSWTTEAPVPRCLAPPNCHQVSRQVAAEAGYSEAHRHRRRPWPQATRFVESTTIQNVVVLDPSPLGIHFVCVCANGHFFHPLPQNVVKYGQAVPSAQTARLEVMLATVIKLADQVFTPILTKQQELVSVKRSLDTLARFQHVFALPGALSRAAQDQS